MVREAPDRAEDSGWVFLAADESQAYLDESSNLAVYDVNTIANYDTTIIPYLYALPGQRYDRDGESGGFSEAPDSEADRGAAGLPAGIDVVQGHVRIAEDWSVRLNSPIRRRREDGSLVLWRPCLTLWIDAFKRASGSVDDCLNAIRKDASPKAVKQRTSTANGAAFFSYRLREDSANAKVPSLYAFVIGDRSHVQFGVFADREADVEAAHMIVESVRRPAS